MLLAELHSRISAEAGGEVACALRIDWILRILTQQIRESVPSQYSFPTIDSKIRAGLDFGVGNIQLTMDQGKVMLSGFTPVILVKEPLNTGDRSYTTIQLEYTEIPLTLAIVDNCPKLFVEQYETTGPPVVIVGKIETKVLDDNKITEQEFLVKLEAFKFSIPYLELLNRFVNSLSIPNVLSALTLFTLQPPYKFFNIGDENSDYIAVTGRTELSEEAFCDCKSSSVKKAKRIKQTLL
ncbi:hypothetical protein LWM68_12705 [Niabella sp. W65]|nr:hypothetical protein [Niabella sp. W65]MCH7363528.1 hypothetical protein [Niabella sp. W65]